MADTGHFHCTVRLVGDLHHWHLREASKLCASGQGSESFPRDKDDATCAVRAGAAVLQAGHRAHSLGDFARSHGCGESLDHHHGHVPCHGMLLVCNWQCGHWPKHLGRHLHQRGLERHAALHDRVTLVAVPIYRRNGRGDTRECRRAHLRCGSLPHCFRYVRRLREQFDFCHDTTCYGHEPHTATMFCAQEIPSPEWHFSSPGDADST
mmetsp:Transcript_72435/g.136822  ORF Transcript_72435/g.136822 Transcript_72435/m.136822 type:complete len:208 (-) Transcript_72435:195-818(-)